MEERGENLHRVLHCKRRDRACARLSFRYSSPWFPPRSKYFMPVSRVIPANLGHQLCDTQHFPYIKHGHLSDLTFLTSTLPFPRCRSPAASFPVSETLRLVTICTILSTKGHGA